jgi:segregation and condensation protein A
LTQRVAITVRLDSFEGPLDLLLYLIQTHELDISKISISKITNQYLAYIQLMQELNFDMASEFLVLAATLLQWKSRSLLPQEDKSAGGAGSDEGEVLTQEDLIRQLMEHQRFLEAGSQLSDLPRLGETVFTRANSKPPVERVWKTMEMTSLALCYQSILLRARKRTEILKKETVSLSDKILEFSMKLPLNRLVDLRTLLPDLPNYRTSPTIRRS